MEMKGALLPKRRGDSQQRFGEPINYDGKSVDRTKETMERLKRGNIPEKIDGDEKYNLAAELKKDIESEEDKEILTAAELSAILADLNIQIKAYSDFKKNAEMEGLGVEASKRLREEALKFKEITLEGATLAKAACDVKKGDSEEIKNLKDAIRQNLELFERS